MKKYIFGGIIIFVIVILGSIVTIACKSEKSDAVAFFYEQAENILYLENIESGRYISKIQLMAQGDTLCINVYKKPIVFRNTKIAASSAWKIESDPKFRNIKCGNKNIGIKSLKRPWKMNPLATEVHPSVYPCTIKYKIK